MAEMPPDDYDPYLDPDSDLYDPYADPDSPLYDPYLDPNLDPDEMPDPYQVVREEEDCSVVEIEAGHCIEICQICVLYADGRIECSLTTEPADCPHPTPVA